MSLLPTPPNPYLAWLDGLADPPFPGTLEDAERAEVVLRRRIQGLRRKAHASVVGEAQGYYEQWRRSYDRRVSLLVWIERTQGFQPKSEKRTWTDACASWETISTVLYTRMHDAHGRAVLRAILRRTSLTEPQRRMFQDALEASKYNQAVDPVVQDLGRQQERRERRFEVQSRREPGVYVHSKQPLERVCDNYLEEARANARKHGHRRGYRFIRDTEGMSAVRKYAKDTSIRRSAWLEELRMAASIKNIEDMRTARQAASTAFPERGAHRTSWMTNIMKDCALGTVPRIERLMITATAAMAPAARSLNRSMLQRAAARNMDLSAPWDRSKLEDVAVIDNVTSVKQDVFPWRATVEKALPELLGLAGWCLRGPIEDIRGGKNPLIRIPLHHPRCGAAQLWYSPCDPSFTPYDYAAAFVQSVRDSWSSPSNDRILWIGNGLTGKNPSFDVESLTLLAHEVGHALHYLSLEGAVPNEPISIPEDVIELPAHLMELYPRDPRVLARWANTPASRRPSYWPSRLRLLGSDVFYERDNAFRAAFDIQIHDRSPSEAPAIDLHQALLAKAGMSMSNEEAMASVGQMFVWGNYAAGLHASQVLAKGLVHRLVTHRRDGQANALEIAALFNNLAEHVLSGATSPERWRRRWRQWMGERIETSARQGLLALGRHHLRVAKQIGTRLKPR